MTADAAALRALVVRAVLENPVACVDDPALVARLSDATQDCRFDEFGFDSLARMEFCIWMQVEAGIEINEGVLLDHPSIDALAGHLARRG
jgi:acyl carrier protein